MIQNKLHIDLHFLMRHTLDLLNGDLSKTVEKTHNANIGITIPTKFTDDIDMPMKYGSMSYPVFIDQDKLEDHDEVPANIFAAVGDWIATVSPVSYPTPENGFTCTLIVEPTETPVEVHQIVLMAPDQNVEYQLEWCTYDAIKSGENPVINVDTKYSCTVPPKTNYVIGLNNFNDVSVPSILDSIVISFNENDLLSGEHHVP